jgi:Ni,Fe-hydrogenase III small subunit
MRVRIDRRVDVFVLLRELQRVRRQVGLKRPSLRSSLAVRHVDAGSCNGCEHELGACFGPHYDLGRYGLSIAASPRHGDVLLVSGTLTTRMVEPLRIAYESMPEPRLVAALGDCPLGCACLGDPGELAGKLEDILPVDIRIPGCPPSPQAISDCLVQALQAIRKGGRPR